MADQDITEKTLESFNDVFSDIINVLLFHGRRVVKEDELEEAVRRSVYKVDQKVREQERDTAKYWKNVTLRISMLGLENETKPQKYMPLRVIGYDGAAYRNQIRYVKDKSGVRRLSDEPRYPVVTLVLYFGTGHWNQPLHLCDSLDVLPDELKPYVSDYKINVFEIAWLTAEQVEMFESDFKIVADYFVQVRKNKDYIPSTAQMKHVQEVLQLMSVLTGDYRFEEVQNSMEEGVELKAMCEVMDRAENRGFEKGHSLGLSEGRSLERQEKITEMLRRGKAPEEIAEFCNYPLELVMDTWKKELNNAD